MSFPSLISSARDVEDLADLLLDQDVIALDAEMDSFFSYQTKLCLIQISTLDEDFLVDPLADVDLSPLQEPFGHREILKLLHAADNDVPYLNERVGGKVGPIFDTQIAAKVLGLPRTGLGGLLQDMFSIAVDKRFQRADWRLRPLPPEQDAYARNDTRHLFALQERLEDMLHEAGAEEEAWSSFRRVNQNPPQRKAPNLDAYLRWPETRKMSKEFKARLRDLFRWRDDLACQRDSAVFRVLPDNLLLALVGFNGNADDLRREFRHPTIQRQADVIVRLLQEAGARPFVAPVVERGDNFLKGPQARTYERLRKWRNGVAAELGLDPDRVFGNRLLRDVVEADPRSLADVADMDGMESWRMEKYGRELWAEFNKR